MADEKAILSGTALAEDAAVEPTLRPRDLQEYIGQDKVRENLGVFLAAARGRGEPLDHVLLTGPPGLGKTTLAYIIARELGTGLRITSGPMIARAGDLAGILTNLQPRDVLFLDEIHRLNPAVEEILYPAMEDFRLDIVIGEGAMARTVKIDVLPSRWSEPRPGPASCPSLFTAGSGSRCASTSTTSSLSRRSSNGRRASWESRSRPRPPGRSERGAAALPASRTACCGGSGTSRRSGARTEST